MAVLLAILKVFGIILAVLVGMILLALLYLLFLPVHVKIYAACDPSPDLRIRILGFLHFFQIRASYREGKSDWSAGAFWGKWVLAPKRAGTKEPDARGYGAGESAQKEKTQASRASTGEARISRQPEISENGKPARATQKSLGERPREEKPKREPPKSGQAEHAPAADERVRKKQAGQTGQRKAGKKRRQRGGSSAAERLRNLGSGLPGASQRRAISFLLREGLAYLKKLCPHLTKADADYSLGDPAWTGELTGIISLWPGVYGKNIHFRPDFESDGIYFRGYVQLESEIYFWQLAFLLLKIYRNEDCRRLFDL